MNSLRYIPDFSVKFYIQSIYTNYANYTYFDQTNHIKIGEIN